MTPLPITHFESAPRGPLWGVVAACLFLAGVLYMGAAWTVFRWRNPTANDFAYWRDFGSVATWKKLPKYQGVAAR